jgi:hypothetical protein
MLIHLEKPVQINFMIYRENCLWSHMTNVDLKWLESTKIYSFFISKTHIHAAKMSESIISLQ